MPIVKIKYDNEQVSDTEIFLLCKALKAIVQEATTIPEVFVYADSPKIKLDLSPIEIFIEMSSSKVPDKHILFNEIKKRISEWKKTENFYHPISATLIPVDWIFEVNI